MYLLLCNCACSLEYSSLSTLAGLSYQVTTFVGSSRWLLKLHLHLSISTALMRPRRPKQYCLQLYEYVYIRSWFNVSYLLSTFKVIFVVVQLLFFWITVFTKQGNEDISIGSSSPLIPSVYVNLILVICDVRLNQLIGCHTIMPKKRLKTPKFSTCYKALISFLR